MDPRFFRRLAEAMEAGEAVVLVTVVEVAGPAPREAGARMLVFPDGHVEGTVGGGPLEHHATHRALALLHNGPQTSLETHDLGDLGMLCGGRATLFYEVLRGPPTLAIFGAGHVGLLLARLSRETTPWRIVVFDDRPERLKMLPPGVEGRFLPDHREVPEIVGTVYAVVASESHDTDFQVAAALLGREPSPAYVGLLGSRPKATAIHNKLLALGIPAEKVQKLRCPVGLPLGGKDPGAVAVSILAELLAFHHGQLARAGERLAP